MIREIPVAKAVRTVYKVHEESHQYHRNIVHFSGDPLKNSNAFATRLGRLNLARKIKSNVT